MDVVTESERFIGGLLATLVNGLASAKLGIGCFSSSGTARGLDHGGQKLRPTNDDGSAIISDWVVAFIGRQGVEAKSEPSTISSMPWLP